jgi:imidazolonepropionase
MAHQEKERVTVWRNARLATLDPRAQGLGEIERGAVATRGGRILFAGAEAVLPAMPDAITVDCDGRWITPGLIDCHTHLVHAGNRAHEFELRLKGATYEDIARAGGGIVSSVRALRAASETDLVAETLPRLDALIAEGVTTVEVKSGYGLDRDSEIKSLRAARALAATRLVTLRTTFLGAHALPPEAMGDRTSYIDRVVEDMLPAVHAEGLADAVDGFCEGIAFLPEEIARVFDRAQTLGLPVKLHADQLSDLGGAALAARYHALSADHLEYTSEAGAAAMAQSGTVAVILPGAYYFIRETKKPPIDAFRRHGVAMAVATDNNPGTSPLTSLLLTMNMAATLFHLTVEECLAGVTRHAARALGLQQETGTLEAGKWADLAIWDIDRPAELVYRMGFNPLWKRVWRGQ